MEQSLSGPMKNENIQCFLDCAEELLRADETERALWLLDNMPAYRRDNPPAEVVTLKNEIMSQIATASFYATDKGCELVAHPEIHKIMKNSLRGDILVKEMKHLNSSGHSPIFVDLAPGEYAFVRLLIYEKIKFKYIPVWVNGPSYNHYLKDFESTLDDSLTPNEPKVFFACEIIEHLHKEDELRHNMNRSCGIADIIHISTPKHTFDTNCLDWRFKGPLGHLRAYCPSEFYRIVERLFPEYELTFFDHQPMHIRGVLKTTKFDSIKNTPIEAIFK